MNSMKHEDTILIVDDVQENVIILSSFLTHKSYNVLSAYNGEQALQICEKSLPDLVLLDIMMPKITGFEVCKILKSQKTTQHIPIIFMTALNSIEEKVKGFSLGAADYLTKPIEYQELLARLNTQLKLHKLQYQLQAQNIKLQQQALDLERNNEIIRIEKNKSDQLLLNILPLRIANNLKETGKTEPEYFENVTVLFSDIVDFTHLSSNIEPRLLIDELNTLFTAFDNIIEKHHCERIKTIGDAYLCACGLPEKNEHHAENIVKAALDMMKYNTHWKIRIGIHTGKVIGGVVGIKKYIYDVFGDTINITSRIETHSEPMKINISETTYHLVKDKFKIIERGAMIVKGKGKMKMYFVETML